MILFSAVPMMQASADQMLKRGNVWRGLAIELLAFVVQWLED